MGRATVTTLALGLEPEWVTDKLKPPVGDLSQNGYGRPSDVLLQVLDGDRVLRDRFLEPLLVIRSRHLVDPFLYALRSHFGSSHQLVA